MHSLYPESVIHFPDFRLVLALFRLKVVFAGLHKLFKPTHFFLKTVIGTICLLGLHFRMDMPTANFFTFGLPCFGALFIVSKLLLHAFNLGKQLFFGHLSGDYLAILHTTPRVDLLLTLVPGVVVYNTFSLIANKWEGDNA